MKVCLYAFLGLLCSHVYAQQGDYVSGAKAAALGNCSILQPDEFASLNNIGALGNTEGFSAFISYRSYFNVSGIGAYAAGINTKVFGGMGTVNFYKFGDQLFSENKVGAGFSHKLGFTSLGIQFNYLQYRIEGYGTAVALVIETGGLAELFPGFFVGLYAWNISKSTLSSVNHQELPIRLKAGILYKPLDTFGLNIEFHDDLEGEVEVVCGMEYFILKMIFLRTGFHVNNQLASFGFGLNPGKIKIDYALNASEHLGLSHQVSMVYQWKKR